MEKNINQGSLVYNLSQRYLIEYEPELFTLWAKWKEYPYFSEEFLTHMKEAMQTVKSHTFQFSEELQFFVLKSDIEDVFSLGGDLKRFVELAEGKNLESLKAYAKNALELLWSLYNGLYHDVITISLIEGKCCGGGFEAALACDYIIAEEGATFSFPEISLGIFPGMGGASILASQTSKKNYLDLTTSGDTFSAEQLAQMGLISLLVEKGQGPAAVRNFIRKNNGRHNALNSLLTLRKKTIGLSYDALCSIADTWASQVFSLDSRRLTLIKHIASLS